jgi:hypothetical protein
MDVDYGAGSGQVSDGILSGGRQPTPGSEADAWRKDEKDTRNKYAKRMGIDGET